MLRELAADYDLIGEVRGLGLMIGVELVTDKKSKTPAKAQAAAIKAHCREAGVLIGVGGQAGNVVRFQPPLTISDNDLETAVETLDAALKSI